MLHKNSFEPKAARILTYYEDDEDDDELADLGVLDSSRPGATRKKKTTGTQALAEFLSTTSPEEFQRNTQQTISSLPVEPSSINFFKLRKSKRTLINRRNNTNNSSSNDLVPLAKTTNFSNAISGLSAISNSSTTMNRKNYIEIVPKTQQQQQQQQQSASQCHQPLPQPQPQTQHSSSPMLPQMGQNKKRDSSLYSGSLRYSASIRSQLSATGIGSASSVTVTTTATKSTGRMIRQPLNRQDTTTTLSTMASEYTTFSKRKQQQEQTSNHQVTTVEDEQKESQEKTTEEADDQQKRALTQSLLSATSNMDVIEAGLIQRLERCTLSGFEKPSDKVAHLLVNEHVRALDVSFHQQEHTDRTEAATKKVRHVQVQTMTMEQDEQQKCPLITTTESTSSTSTSSQPQQQQKHVPALSLSTGSASSSSSLVSGSQLPSPASDSGVGMDDEEVTTTSTCSQATTIDRLEKELTEEKKHRQRLEVSLNDTRDHFEVLSGLAYKKLREIWEEKLKWENACMELNQQLMITQQQQQHQQHQEPQEEESNHQGSDDIEDINSVMGKDSISVVS